MARDTGFKKTPAANAANNTSMAPDVREVRELARKGVRTSEQLQKRQERAKELEALGNLGAAARLDTGGTTQTKAITD
jgi:hypothetical protein